MADIPIDVSDGYQSESEPVDSAGSKHLTTSDLFSAGECTAVAPVTRNKSGKKRRRRTQADEIWSHSRKHVPGLEPERCEVGRRLWYCKVCPSYSVSSTSGARGHMASVHSVVVSDELMRGVKKAKYHDVRQMLSKQALAKQEEASHVDKLVLQAAADPTLVKAAWIRLLIRHDLPHNSVSWPELHTFVHTINHMASGILPTSSATVRSSITATFKQKQKLVRDVVHGAKSRIHITTDTWHSPASTEFQAINAHFVDGHGRLRKALLNLVELGSGHSGEAVAEHVIHTLEFYGVKDRLGFLTGDNHGANDTLCRAIARNLGDWNPVDNRLRCLGHIINLAVQAFLFAKSEEAVAEAERQSQRCRTDMDYEIAAGSIKMDGHGWSTILPLQKLHGLVLKLNKSDRLKLQFKKLTKGRTIHSDNETRWNSWFFTIESALRLQFEVGQFIHDNHKELGHLELSHSEWQILRETLVFLQPFKEAAKRCEGDNTTLDQLHETMDFLVNHFDEQMDLHRANKPFIECIMVGWYTLDKYYNKIDETGAYAAAILLHPNKRKAYLQAVWRRGWVKPGLRRAEDLWARQYERLDAAQDSTTLCHRSDDREPTELTSYEIWQRQRSAKIAESNSLSSEFKRFVDAPAEAIRFHDSFTVLDWWQEPSQKRTYPRLSLMALDVLSAPAMSAEAERVFSRARRQISFDRECLKPDIIGQKECLKSWHIQQLVDETVIVQESYEPSSTTRESL